MSYPVALKLQPKQAHTLKQTQKLIMLPQMQQAIHMLQLPIMELSTIIDEEIQQNPLLEYSQDDDQEKAKEAMQVVKESETPFEKEITFDDKNFEILKQLDEDFRDHFLESGNFYKKRSADDDELRSFQESLICAESTLFEHLMQQAHETFDDHESLHLAEQLIGNFDQNGFLQTPLKEIALLAGHEEEKIRTILCKIQSFEPYGVGAQSLQESFLIQLKCLGKEETLAHALLSQCYDHLLHNRIPLIQKDLGKSLEEIQKAIHQIAKLDLHPGLWFSKQVTQHIVPDVTIRQQEDRLIAEIDGEALPSLRLNSRYMRMLDDETLTQEAKDFIKHKIVSAKWLMRNIQQRNQTILRIAESLARIQKDFFLLPEGKLVPITMKVLAEELSLHESTIARAVTGKYMNTPKGLYPLRSFFTTAYVNEKGDDISATTVRDALLEIIQSEDKLHPFSDEHLSLALSRKGIKCARRTIAKYRTELNIGNALQRKKF